MYLAGIVYTLFDAVTTVITNLKPSYNDKCEKVRC